jgi:hypothetical protein
VVWDQRSELDTAKVECDHHRRQTSGVCCLRDRSARLRRCSTRSGRILPRTAPIDAGTDHDLQEG